MIKEQQASGFSQRICSLSVSVSASSQQSATREQTEMEMREGAAQGHPDNTEWYVERVSFALSPSLSPSQ